MSGQRCMVNASRRNTQGQKMSKSLARVSAALSAAGLSITPLEMAAETRTAAQAAAAAGCTLDQIVKSIILQGKTTCRLHLFLTAGGSQVDLERAAALVGDALARADADTVRRVTGFAIGGVAPLGHLEPIPVHADPRLLDFAQVWAAAGTPRHIFPIAPTDLVRITHATVIDFASTGANALP
jgi:prolyl-tRNA editing enzyme YbaK/EbsC (Cys-tRNA(Pro) deacylase)